MKVCSDSVRRLATMGRLRCASFGGIISILVLVSLGVVYLLTSVHGREPPPPEPSSELCDNNNRTSKCISSPSPSVRKLAIRSENNNNEVQVRPSHRLPKTVIPEGYFLQIVPILESGFETSLGEQWFAPGNVSVNVTAVKGVRVVTLHAKNVTVHNVTVKESKTGDEVPVRNITFSRRHSFMLIHLAAPLTAGNKYQIDISFTSYVSEVLNGLFRSSYVNPKTGQLEWFAATHMEALHARQMFPCLDEPGYKASIQAKVGRREDVTALFNTESLKNETMAGVEGWVWETFAPSVPMSTYLTALVIGKFEYTQAPGVLLPNIRVRTYAPPHHVTEGAAKYAAATSEKILHAYGEYFKEKFPMNKFDSVAVPSFLYGAMENYGLSIFKESLLLHFDNSSTEASRYIVTMVIAHELGHQWYGNLVTMDWWTHLWLSEGITKFTEYIGMNATIPEFLPWDLFLIESLQAGLRLDADPKTSHSLKIDEDSWSMKYEMEWFDDIAYKKGGSLIRMMQGFLSEPVLRKGLSRYLSRLKFKSAVQDDLFADCDKEGQLAHKLPDNTTLKDVMTGWTLKSGFPLLKVSLGGNDIVKISQEKYMTTRTATNSSEASSGSFKWFIPVSIATSKKPSFDPEPELWIRNNETEVEFPLPSGNSWIIANAGVTGFYRVVYDEELSNRIVSQLMDYPNTIDKLSRSQLMDDFFTAAWNRYIPVERALNLSLYMKEHAETEHVVWTSFLSMLKTGFRLFRGVDGEMHPFREYMLPRIEKGIQASGGYSAVDLNTKGVAVLRHAQLLDWACNLDSRECVQYATEMVKSWMKSGMLTAPRDFQNVIFSAAVANDFSGEIFDFVKEQYMKMFGDERGKLREQLLTALANTRNEEKLRSMLDSILIRDEDSWIDSNDTGQLLQHLGTNPQAVNTTLNYFSQNLLAIISSFGSTAPITLTVNAMAPYLKSLNSLFLIEKLMQSNDGVLQSPLSAAFTRIRANIMWHDDFGENMIDFFKRNK